MSESLSVRLPPHVEQKLAAYCTRQGITRTEALVRALDAYLDAQSGGTSAFALAADLIPKRGARDLQSANVRKLARDAFRGARAR
jgi:predicted DNA-binding protein